MGKIAKYTRRGFLGLGIAAAGGLAVGYYYYKKPYPNPLPDRLEPGDFSFTPYVIIGEDNQITIITPRAEMGQGTHTTLAALVAEELEVGMDQIRTEHGPAAPVYYNGAMMREGAPFAFFDDGFMAETARKGFEVLGKFLALQVTGGSSAMIDAYDKMREAGATARVVLVQAAAQRWNTPADDLIIDRAEVIHPNGDRLTYGALASAAARLDLPEPPPLKDPAEWRILGKSQPRVELYEKVTGAPIYGIDVQLPDMLYATVAMSPRFGAKALSADKAAAMAVPGVLNVVEIMTTAGVGFGIVASNTWAAFQGAQALAPEWEAARYPEDTVGLKALWNEALAQEASFTLGGEGDPEAAMQGAEVIEAHYSLPYLAHTTMEPMNATAQFANGKLRLWLGTQAPGIAAMTTAKLLGIDSSDVEVVTTRLGGGFGRRTEVDAPLFAAAIAAQTGGKPVKVTWSREEDIRHDTYRPMAEARLRGTLKNGLPEALDYRIAAPSINKSVMGRSFPEFGDRAGADRSILDGSFDQPFSWPHSRFAAHQVDVAIPVGFWRSVGNSINGFVHESFLDELAAAGGQDPLEMRLTMMKDPRHAPAREALKMVAQMSGWGRSLPAGVGLGVAHTLSFGTWVAEVVQVDMRGGAVKVDEIWAVADPGLVLDPANFKAQVSSAVIYGLSAAIGQEITFADGRVMQENFFDYDALRMAGVPPINVALLENSPRMGGAGEPGTPPIAAALGNAIFAASGQRLRALPFGNKLTFDLG